jgi:hypothetical protein
MSPRIMNMLMTEKLAALRFRAQHPTRRLARA